MVENLNCGLKTNLALLLSQDYFHLPNTPNGDSVIFHRLKTSRSGHYNFDDAIKTFFMTIGELNAADGK